MSHSTMIESNPQLQKIWEELGITREYLNSYKLPAEREATELIFIETTSRGRDIYLAPDAAEQWKRMKSAAKKEGIVLLVAQGFRSIGFQAQFIKKRLKEGKTLEQVLTYLAVPGFSEHHTGHALDIGSEDCFPPTEELAKTKAYEWMLKHAREFQFHLTYPENNAFGIVFEPWHWCHRPGVAS
jgi:zinc D-Ala-D-Ala carboxypeptidase